MFIKSMNGFGDSIYIRGFAHAYRGHYIETPFPELFEDLGLKCVKPETDLRTQSRHIEQSKYKWYPKPERERPTIVKYGHKNLQYGSIISALKRILNTQPNFTLPETGKSPIEHNKLAIIRPVTIRSEWKNTSRAPKPEYIYSASQILKEKGYYIVSIADIEDGKEWLEGTVPYADTYFHNGELSFMELLALIKSAKVVVGGVGWIVPACIASKTPAYFILGGNGLHNAPEKITDRNYMDLSRIGWAKPDKFCMCSLKEHDCNKYIGDFDGKFTSWLDKLSRR